MSITKDGIHVEEGLKDQKNVIPCGVGKVGHESQKPVRIDNANAGQLQETDKVFRILPVLKYAVRMHLIPN